MSSFHVNSDRVHICQDFATNKTFFLDHLLTFMYYFNMTPQSPLSCKWSVTLCTRVGSSWLLRTQLSHVNVSCMLHTVAFCTECTIAGLTWESCSPQLHHMHVVTMTSELSLCSCFERTQVTADISISLLSDDDSSNNNNHDDDDDDGGGGGDNDDVFSDGMYLLNWMLMVTGARTWIS